MSRSIALLNFAFWPEVQRGSERIVHDLAVDLVGLGHAPTVVTSHRGRSVTATEDGFQVIRNRRPPDTALALRRFQDNLTHVPLSYLSLRRGGYDVAHAFYPTDALAAVRYAQDRARPSVFSYMGIPSRATASYKRGRMKIVEQVTTRSDAVVGLSKTACDELWRWWGVDARLIYPGVELSSFAGVEGPRAEQPTIACAASPDDERKRVPLLVEAFAHVRREHPAARLVLMRPSSERLQGELGRPGVEFFDPSPDAVADVFANAWISALASRDEAFGLVVVESLATGTPVVAADEAGPAEILDRDGIGTLFGDATRQTVAKALLEALELSKDIGTAARCRDRAADFTSERSAREHVELYEELLG